ncbi:hypothetical protein [Streptomyces clavuligerus]|uniref:Secreted protein n=1 Tax=Streptomyces clavuligerus TaxID=1901 RepID=B5GNM5_STRCL|nr:hypothetical protein [Streptomyces clavuligerus]ANW18747.1 hypothetical protein BB341_11160 [Streptomyces clavuligerus]AXU13314.1 hypothetical protein D1794_11535 [Streptomyces clavuligerus]EDY47847.1 hypothetical protein SSCG_00875 [Streptomyces clavuligerus]EFG08579.1 Hypothetical protein SCLAV_3507 [Streptomyces clavuligerus]MBY6303266.1 hypothetical protein [Streptomyces clavuligerus]
MSATRIAQATAVAAFVLALGTPAVASAAGHSAPVRATSVTALQPSFTTNDMSWQIAPYDMSWQ